MLKNKTEIVSYSPQPDEFLINPKLENIVNYPEWEIKRGPRYCGSVYCGVAPSDCTAIYINGNEATLQHMTFKLNGRTADFQLYYCIVEEGNYPDSVELICMDSNGDSYQISVVDGAEHSQVDKIISMPVE